MLVINATCTNEKISEKINFEGTVYDTLGGNVVKEINVELGACTWGSRGLTLCDGYTVGNALTDGSGHFKIQNSAARTNRYSIILQDRLKHLSGYLGFGITIEDIKNGAFSKLYLKK